MIELLSALLYIFAALAAGLATGAILGLLTRAARRKNAG